MSTALQNAKGPAGASTPCQAGSTNPSKEKEMNMAKATTGSAEAPVPKDLSDLFEIPISDAQRMTSILAHILEDRLGKDMSKSHGEQGANCYYLRKSDREDILFSIYKIQDHVDRIWAAFEEATA